MYNCGSITSNVLLTTDSAVYGRSIPSQSWLDYFWTALTLEAKQASPASGVGARVRNTREVVSLPGRTHAALNSCWWRNGELVSWR